MSEPDTVYHSIEAEQWKKLPIHTLRDIIMLQSGVVDCRGDLHIRGGFAENIEYWIDGVPLYIPNLPKYSKFFQIDCTQEKKR